MEEKCGHVPSEMQEECRQNTQDSCEVLRYEHERIRLRTNSMILRWKLQAKWLKVGGQ
jgi:hypothetical protein